MTDTLPNLGLTGNYAEHETGWAESMNANLLLLSVLGQCTVLDRVAAIPDVPAEGDIYVLTADPNKGAIAAFVGGEWLYAAPKEGWLAYDQAADAYITYQGGTWKKLATGSTGGSSGGGAGGGSRLSSTRWRVAAMYNTVADNGFKRLEFLDENGDDLCVGGAASASSAQANTPASNAFGNVNGTYWYAVKADYLGSWIEYTFPDAVAPVAARITPDPSYPAGAPKLFAIEAFVDDEWRTPGRVYVPAVWAENVPQAFQIPAAAGGGAPQVALTQAAYDALPVKDPDTFYYITG